MEENRMEAEEKQQDALYAKEAESQGVQMLLDAKKKGSFKKGLAAGIAGCFAVVTITVAALAGTGIVDIRVGQQKNNVLTNEVEKKLDKLIGQIDLYYYEDVDADKLATGLYKGLFEGLDDPYSVYYTEEEYDDMMISTNANYYGIGAVLSQDKDTMKVTITKVYEDSPAKKAGLKAGDMIVQVGDITATSMELSDLVTKIRGEEGTTVHLKIYRDGENDYQEIDVERGKVDIPTVSSKMLEDSIGYIQVSEFAENTADQFKTAVKDLQDQGMKAMIIDLRDNGGGLLTSCQEMLDEILPEGTVVYTEDKYGNRQDLTSDAEHYLDLPLAVLVNGNSASASEIFAGAIRDFDYGTLIGTKTFGKGIVQNIKQLADGSAYKLTVAKYYTPSGEYIHGKGIEPDVTLEYEYTGDTDADTYDQMKDNQVLKAIEVLQSEIK